MNNDNVNHPSHYAGCSVNIECIDITRHLPFDLGNAVKYMWRAGRKGNSKAKEVEDLRKAIWYLQDHIKHFSYRDDCTANAYAIINTIILKTNAATGKSIPIAYALELIIRHRFLQLIDVLIEQIHEIENSNDFKGEMLLNKITGNDKK